MRAAEDLIHELQSKAEGTHITGLLIRFEETTLFVFASEGDPLASLSRMMRNGGEPPCSESRVTYENLTSACGRWRNTRETQGSRLF
jgi:hypothetical protein